MKIKYIVGTLIIISLLLLIGCSSNNSSTTGNAVLDNNPIKIKVDKVEVYHFHATRQCWSCKTVGAYSEETVNTYFQKELKYGKLVFGHINIDKPENKALAEKYGAKGSSLLIGVYGKDGSFTKEENTNVWYKLNNKQEFVSYLKGVIEQKFSEN